MKTKYLFTLLFLLLMIGVNAQQLDVEGDAILRDGTPSLSLYDTAGGELRTEGTLDENGDDIRLSSFWGDLLFRTGDAGSVTNRLSILGSNGNVGIGTTSPSDELHVFGDMRLDGVGTRRLSFYNGATHTSYFRQFSTGRIQLVNLTAADTELWTNAGSTLALKLDVNGIASSPYGRIGGSTDGLSWAFGVTGQSIFNGFESNGTSQGGLNIRSGGQVMWVDGNEIDSNVELHLNYNTLNDVNIRTNVDRADINIEHGSSSGSTKGVSIENEEANNNYWTLYTVNSNGDFELYKNGAKRGDFDTTSGVYTSVSDRKLKTNITDLPSALDKVMASQPKSYTFISDESNREYIGFIAQELETVFPQVVHKGTVGDTAEELYTVDYASLTAAAFQAIKEQQAIIEQLLADVEELKKK